MIFGDATLRQMARLYPDNEKAMNRIFGMGEKKREEFGAVFAAAVREYLASSSRQHFEA